MVRIKHSEGGMTLVELIISIAILGIIVIPVGTVFIKNYTEFYKETAKINASHNMRNTFNEMLEALRGASQASITVPDGDTVSFITNVNGVEKNSYIKYQADKKQIIAGSAGSDRILLKSVVACAVSLDEGFVSIKVSTETYLPFEGKYIYTRTYDYKVRQ